MSVLLKRVSNLPFAPVVGGMFAVAAAVLVASTPTWLLSEAVGRTAAPALFPMLGPPLGNTARMGLAVFAALSAGVIVNALMRPVGARLDRPRVTEIVADVAEHRRARSIGPASQDQLLPLSGEQEPGAPVEAGETLELPPSLAAALPVAAAEPAILLEAPEPVAASDITPPEVPIETPADALVETPVETLPVEQPVAEEPAERVQDMAAVETEEPLLLDEALLLEDEADPVATGDAEPALAAVVPAPLPEPAPVPAAPNSLADLMGQLEQGLEKRVALGLGAPRPRFVPIPQPTDQDDDMPDPAVQRALGAMNRFVG